MAMRNTHIYAGTSGYSYKAWQGSFYPPELKQADWLSYYASQLPAVEINNTFYRMPSRDVVSGWRDAVPDQFRFVIKASRRITHQSRLKDAEESTAYLISRAELLQDKLGALLFQLPPFLRFDQERLQRFQALLPADLPCAFEFRHESWLDNDVDKILADGGHSRVVTHDEGNNKVELPDGDLLYLRLRGFNYTLSELRRWQRNIQATNARRALVFFKHEDDGKGPQLAKRLLQLDQEAKPTPKKAGVKQTTSRRARKA